jgi:acyl-CoA thioesterase-1
MQDIRICFLGDSFVNGAYDETVLGWAGRLCAAAARMGSPVTYYNLGVRRNTSRDILLRWEQECALRLPDTYDCRLVLSCGVNDTVMGGQHRRISVEESCANVREILSRAKKYNVIMVGPTPITDDEHNRRVGDISLAFAREALALGTPFVDLFSRLASDQDYRREVASNEGLHPRSTGYAKIAAIIGSSPHWWFHEP